MKQNIKSNNFTGSNRKKSNIAFAKLETILCTNNIFGDCIANNDVSINHL